MVDPARPFGDRIVVMARTDGLGERLCAMMNAMRFADILKTDFRFRWTSDIWNPVYHKLDVTDPKAVLGQSVAPQEVLFDPAFIRDYALEDFEPKAYRAFPTKPITWRKLQDEAARTNFKGWQPDQHMMEGQCDRALLKAGSLTYAEAFARIGFHADIAAVIAAARAVEIAPFDAVHLRSGDMVFGEVRKWGQWHSKVLNAPIAAHLIRQRRAEGRQVLLFGQDKDGLHDLAASEGCLFVGDLLPEGDMSVTHRAIFEIVLMSRGQSIFAGQSGFSRAACMIGGVKLTSPMRLYQADAYADLTLENLRAHEANYHPMVAAYAYWQAYTVGKTLFNLPDHLATIERAQALDADNLLYTMIRMAILYRMGRDAEAEDLVGAQAARTGKTIEATRAAMAEQLTFKYYSTDFTHRDEFTAFQGAALRPRNAHAIHFAARIKEALR